MFEWTFSERAMQGNIAFGFTRHNPYYEVKVKQESNISGMTLLVQFGRYSRSRGFEKR